MATLKPTFVQRILMACMMALMLAATPAKAEKYALIIANGNYDLKTVGWSAISSGNDVALIEHAALSQGFAKDNITVRKDIDKQGFVTAFKQLEQKLTAKDIVLVHISSHGQQIQDDNGDELDGLDEAIVPIDAPFSLDYSPGYKGEKHLRDDELGKMIQALRTRVSSQGQVLVILDACHSGTATRGGNAKARGTNQPFWFETPKDKATKQVVESSTTGFVETSGSRGNTTNLGKLIVVSGAKAEEQNFETLDDLGRDVGSLSYAFSKVMKNLDSEVTYRSLFAQISVVMARKVPYQTPVIEGDIDVQLFGGDVIEPSPYFQVLSREGTGVLEINGGLTAGVGKGSTLLICKAGTLNPMKEVDNVIGEGVVTSAENFTAKVKLNDGVKIYNTKEAWVFVKEQSLNEARIKVDLNEVADPVLKKQLQQKLSAISTVEICESGWGCDVTVVASATASRGASKATIKTCDYNFPCDVSSDGEGCVNLIKDYSRASFIKSLDFFDEGHNISLQLIPAKAEMINGKVVVHKQYDILDYSTSGGVPEIPTDVQLLLQIKNHGSKPTYFSIIDIQPDGIINPILPYNGVMSKEECRLEPYESKIVPGYFVMLYPPYGLETFKIFSSENPIDLTPIISSKGEQMRGSRGSMGALEALLQDSYSSSQTTTRGGSLVYAANGGSGTAKSTVFRIVQPKTSK